MEDIRDQEREAIIRELERYGQSRRGRDPMVLRALAGGVSRKDIARLTGLGHSTIERIVARHKARGNDGGL